MKRLTLYCISPVLFVILIVTQVSGQSVPFPSNPDPTILEPWGYSQVGTSWDTSPFLPFIYNYDAFRLMPPNGVSYDEVTNEWSFDEEETYPVILFFHGKGEAGNDNNNQLKHGGKTHRDAVLSGEFPGFLVYPQNMDIYAMKGILDQMIAEGLPVDKTRIYVHGLSNGAKYSWQFADQFPETVAAVFPMSGIIGLNDYSHMVYSPMRLAQGSNDNNPNPGSAQGEVDQFREFGGQLEYFYLEGYGHNTWNAMYSRSDFFTWFLEQSLNKIYAQFDNYEVCPEDEIQVTLGVNPGHGGYEWKLDDEIIIGANEHEYLPTEFGDYSVRIKLDSSEVWTAWSEVKTVTVRQPTPTPSIELSKLTSVVVPNPNGDMQVALELPEGYESYEWFQDGDYFGDSRIIMGSAGVITAKALEPYGCSSIESEPFVIYSNTGVDVPELPTSLFVSAQSKTEINITWVDNSDNEIAFELYRRITEDAPYELITVLDANSTSYLDSELLPGTIYRYSIRAINHNGASTISDEKLAETERDLILPSAPANLALVSTSVSTVSLSWDDASDDVGVKRYYIYQDSVKVLSTSSTELTIYNLDSANYYSFNVVAVDFSDNESVFSNRVVVKPTFEGLRYKYYEGSWTVLPNFDELTPLKTGVVDEIDLSMAEVSDYYAVYWEGFINIPVAGNYTFETYSDDGSKMYIGAYDEDNLLVDNDGLHGGVYVAGTYDFPSPGVYPIVLTFFERTGGAQMKLYWKNTAHGIGSSRQLVPATQFTGQAGSPVEVLNLPTNIQATALDYDEISISWEDNSDIESAYQIFRSTNDLDGFVAIGSVAADETTFVDKGLNHETSYYYKIAILGEYSEELTLAAVSATTLSLPDVPSIPESFVLGNVTENSIQLSWTQSNVDGFEVFKSQEEFGNYLLVAELNGEVNTFEETELDVHEDAYYKIRSINITGYSDFSTALYGQVLNQLPVWGTVIDNISLENGDTISLELSGTDADGDVVSFELLDNPEFVSLVDSEGDFSLFISPGLETEGLFETIGIKILDSFGGIGATQEFNIEVVKNQPPVITALEDFLFEEIEPEVFVVEIIAAQSSILNFDFSDLENDDLTSTVLNLPGYGDYQDDSDVSGSIVLQPTLSDLGQSEITLQVNDGKNIVELTFSLSVVAPSVDEEPEYEYESAFVNFTPSSNYVAASPWNNMVGTPSVGKSINNIVDENGISTDINVTLLSAWSATSNDGSMTGDDSGVYPDYAISTYYADDSDSELQIALEGLSSDKVYDIVFFGSRAGKKAFETRTTQYTIGDLIGQLTVNNNSTETVVLKGISIDETGSITVNISKYEGSWFYINAMEIRYYDEPLVPLYPSNLNAQAQSHQQIGLSWDDNSSNETGFEIYRAIDPNGTWDLLTTVNENETTYVDSNGLLASSLYYYEVRAINGNGYSAFSNRASEPTLAYSSYQTILINFTSKSSLLASNPWNNVVGNPNAGLGISNLKNNYGVETSIGVELVNRWSSGNSNGQMTGDDSGVFPDVVMNTYFADDSGSDREILITGLDQSKLHDLILFGSRGSITDERISQYSVNGQVVELLVDGNTDRTVEIKSLIPDSNGELLITVSPISTTWRYINAIKLNYYDEPLIPFAPSDLVVEAKSYESIEVTWNDNSTNEDGFEVYGSSSENGTWSLLATVGANVTSFLNEGLSDDSEYFYKVKAINGDGNSVFTESGSAITYVYSPFESIYINFAKSNVTVSNPWNMVGSLAANFKLENLLNGYSSQTTVDVELMNSWGAGNSTGASTGDDSGVYPDNAISTYIANDGASREILFSDLDQNKLYDVICFGSRGGISDDRITIYSSGGKSESLNATNNVQNTVTLSGLKPDSNNEIELSIDGSGWFYVNAIELQYYDEPLTPFAPSNLIVDAASYDEVMLSWTDNSTNETGFEIYRTLSSMPSDWEIVTVTSNDVTSYLDMGLSSETEYVYKIRAINDNGVSDYSIENSVTTFEFSPFEYVYVNFTSSSSAVGDAPWNNFSGYPFINNSISSLVNSFGAATDLEISLVNGWSVGSTSGATTGENSGVYPDNVIKSYFADDSAGDREILLSGLDGTKLYDLTFFASRGNVSDTRSTIYSVEGNTVELTVSNNVSNTVELRSLTPDENDEILIIVSRPESQSWTYINALAITSYEEQDIPFAPDDLVAQASLDNVSVLTSWTDNSTNETAFEIFKSLDGEDWTSIDLVGANINEYNDLDVESGQNYYYKVQAVNENKSTVSDYSNVAVSSLKLFSVLINFNVTDPAASPWNNTNIGPYPGMVLDGLLSTDLQGTGISMEILEDNPLYINYGFAGDNPFGSSTGDDSGVVPDNVMKSTFWLDPGMVGELAFHGMNLSYKYSFEFFASRDASGNRNTDYIIDGESVTLNAANNTSDLVSIDNVTADENSDVTVTVKTNESASYGYLGAVMIHAYVNDGSSISSSRTFEELEEIEILEESESLDIIYPNPFTESLTLDLELDNEYNKVHVRIVDIYGRAVFENRYDYFNQNENIHISTDSFNSGMYFVEIVKNDSSRNISRVIKR